MKLTNWQALLVALPCFMGGLFLADRGEAQGQAAGMKIAVVDLNEAMNQVNEGKSAIASLEKRFNERRLALEKKQKELVAMQDDLQKKALVMSEDAKRTKAQELQERYMEFQMATRDAEGEMANMRAQLEDDLAGKLRTVCNSIGQREGYTFILEKRVVWFSPASADITNKLIAAYNAQPPKTPAKK